MNPVPAQAQVLERLGDIQSQLALLSERVGHESDDGSGGTGLTGRLIRTEAKVDELTGLRNKAIGAVAAVTLVSTLLLLGLKAWVHQFIGARQ